MIIETVHEFVNAVRHGEIEVYNEFSLQHELGIVLRAKFQHQKVRFERNVSFFFTGGEFIKREIDIAVFAPDKSKLSYAIELKFPRNGQYPEQMFSFCRDILFVEQLRQAGFERSFLIIFADDPLFYAGAADGIYGYFRQGRVLCGSVQKPTGKRDETITLRGTYELEWTNLVGKLRYTIVEAAKVDK